MEQGRSDSDRFGGLRKKAEELLKASEGQALPPDARGLREVLHELSVHQVELEMQNEELLRARRELEESGTRYRHLFDFAPVGYFTLDFEGRFLSVNRTLLDLMNASEDRLLGKPFAQLVPAEHRGEFYRLLAGARGGQARIELVRPDSSRLHALFQLEPGRSQDGQAAERRGAVVDLTAQWQAEADLGELNRTLERRVGERTEALRDLNVHLEERVAQQTAAVRQAHAAVLAERQRLYSVLETLPVYVILLTPDHRVPYANRFFEERFGKSGGKKCYEYLFPRTEPCETCETFKVFQTHAPHHWEWTGPDGRDYDIHDFPFTDTDGSPLVMEMGIDVTEAKKAQAALKAMNATLEQRVADRTAELTASNEELARFNRAMVGREFQMIELKKEINALCSAAGRPPRYDLDFADPKAPSPSPAKGTP